VAEWEPTDDLTTIMIALAHMDEKLDAIGEQLFTIRALLEDDEEEEEDD
jgi:hypothetical protein